MWFVFLIALSSGGLYGYLIAIGSAVYIYFDFRSELKEMKEKDKNRKIQRETEEEFWSRVEKEKTEKERIKSLRREEIEVNKAKKMKGKLPKSSQKYFRNKTLKDAVDAMQYLNFND